MSVHQPRSVNRSDHVKRSGLLRRAHKARDQQLRYLDQLHQSAGRVPAVNLDQIVHGGAKEQILFAKGTTLRDQLIDVEKTYMTVKKIQ